METFIKIINTLKNKHRDDKPVTKLIYELIIFCWGLLRDNKITVQSKSLIWIDKILNEEEDLEILDDKARKWIWTNALYFSKSSNALEIKMTSIKIAARIHNYLLKSEDFKKEAEEITRHFWYLVLKDQEESIRVEAFRWIPPNESTLDVILSRTRDICKKIREIAYEKIQESEITLENIPESQRIDILYSLLYEPSAEIKQEAIEAIELIVFKIKKSDKNSQTEQKSSTSLKYIIDKFITKWVGISAEIGSIIIELVTLGWIKYYDIPYIVDNEGKVAWNELKKQAEIWRTQNEYEVDWVEILKNLLLLRFLLSYLKQDKDFIGLYIPLCKELPKPTDWRYIFKLSKTHKQYIILEHLVHWTQHIQFQKETSIDNQSKESNDNKRSDFHDLLKDYKKLILDAEQFHALDTEQEQQEISEKPSKSIWEMTSMKKEDKFISPYQEVWDIMYSPISPSSPYILLETLMSVYKILTDKVNKEDEEISEENCFFNQFMSSLKSSMKKVDKDSEWSSKKGGWLSEQFKQLSEKYKQEKNNYKELKKTKRDLEDKIAKSQFEKKREEKAANKENEEDSIDLKDLFNQKEDIWKKIDKIKDEHKKTDKKMKSILHEDVLFSTHFLLVFKELIRIWGKEYVKIAKNKSLALENVLKTIIEPFLIHEGSKDIQLLALDWLISAATLDENIALNYLKYFKDIIDGWNPKNLKRSHEDDDRDNYEISDDDTSKDKKKITVNEVIKSIAVLFDWFIVHEFLSKEKLHNASKDIKFLINDIKTLLVKRISIDNKLIQQLVLEGFFKLLIMEKLQKPIDILSRILILREESKPYLEKQSKKIRKSIDDFIVQYAKISKSTAMNLFKSFWVAISFINLAKGKGYSSPWKTSKEGTIAIITLPQLTLKFNVAFGLFNQLSEETNYHLSFLEYATTLMVKHTKSSVYLGIWIPKILSVLSINELHKLSPSTLRSAKNKLSWIARIFLRKYAINGEVSGKLSKEQKDAVEANKWVEEFVIKIEKSFGMQIDRYPSNDQLKEDVDAIEKGGDIDYEAIWQESKLFFDRYMTKDGEYQDKKNEVERVSITQDNNEKKTKKQKKPLLEEVEKLREDKEDDGEDSMSDREIMSKYKKKMNRFA